MNKPIVLSLVGLVFIAVVTVVILAVWKPDFVVGVNNDKKKKINWGKLVSLSCVLGILAAIILYISTMKSAPSEKILLEPAEMGFGKVSDCY